MSLLVEPDVSFACPDCGVARIISARQRRRILNGVHDARCFWCRTGRNRLHPEKHFRFWLEYAGVELPRNADPLAWCLENGVPPLLLEIAGEWTSGSLEQAA